MALRRSAPLTITRGDDYTHYFSVTGDGAAAANTWTVVSKVRARASDDDALATFTTGAVTGAGTTEDPWVFPLTLAAATTRTLPVGLSVFDIQRTVSGTTKTVLSGTVLVEEDVSR